MSVLSSVVDEASPALTALDNAEEASSTIASPDEAVDVFLASGGLGVEEVADVGYTKGRVGFGGGTGDSPRGLGGFGGGAGDSTGVVTI